MNRVMPGSPFPNKQAYLLELLGTHLSVTLLRSPDQNTTLRMGLSGKWPPKETEEQSGPATVKKWGKGEISFFLKGIWEDGGGKQTFYSEENPGIFYLSKLCSGCCLNGKIDVQVFRLNLKQNQ